MPNDNSPGAEKESGNSEKYAHSHGSTMTAQAFTARTAASHAGFFLPHVKPQMSVLDCGCGRGSITVGLAQAVNPGKVVGIDIGETEVSAAIKHAKEVGVSNTEFAQASIYEIPCPDETFDAVFSHAAIEHLNEPVEALIEMKRVLNPYFPDTVDLRLAFP